jgi:hypothetical protein
MTRFSKVGIAVDINHADELDGLTEKIEYRDKWIRDETKAIAIFEFIHWEEDEYEHMKNLMSWLRTLPDKEWGVVEIYSNISDEGQHVATEGQPYNFGLFYKCDLHIECNCGCTCCT